MVGIMWAVLAGISWAFVGGFFGLALWTARKAGKEVPPMTYASVVIPAAVPLSSAYASYYFSGDPLLPLSALAIGSMFAYSLALLIKKRLSPKT